jgi:hypothetical protein
MQPQAVVRGDFNNDTRLDLAVANYSDASVSMLLGNTDGTFRPALTTATGSYPAAVAVGDFNIDGKLDLVTAHAGGGICVLLGNGNGAFQAQSWSFLGTYPSSVAVGDFNADGKLDLGVVSNWPDDGYISYLNVLLGTGSGTFSAPITSSAGEGFHYASAVADFNGDNNLDFAASSEFGTVEVALGNGTGSFGYPETFGIVTYAPAISLVAGDLNNDGKTDLATSNSHSFGNFVTVLIGNGLGWFTTAQQCATDSLSGPLPKADFNGDGNADLVVASDGTGAIGVLLGTGAGSFRPPVTTVVNAAHYGIAVGDFNGDGRPDAAASNANANTVSVLLNDGVWPGLGVPALAVNDVSVTESNMGTADATFTVSLSAASDQPVTVRYATVDGAATAGSDYHSLSGTLTFAPGETVKTVTVLVNGDRLAEFNESFRLVLTDPTNAFLADSSGAGSIVDDEPHVAIDFGPVYVTEGNSGTTSAVFTVRLSTAYDVPVGVSYATGEGDTEGWYDAPPATPGTDFEAASGTLTFAPGETVRTIAVVVNGDRLAETISECFSLNLTGSAIASIDAAHALGVIVDADPWVTLGDGTATEGNTGTTVMTFTVSLSSAYDLPITVNYATSGGSASAGSDYRAASGSLTIPAGQTTGTISVLVNGDRLAEPDETFVVNLSGATSATIADGQGVGTILDDEPRISISDVSKSEGRKGKTTLFTFTVSLSSAYDQAVTMSFRTVNGTAKTSDQDYIARTGTLTFAPGETTKTITIVVNGDSKMETDETLFVDLFGNSSNALFTKNRGLGTILNDD